MSPANGDPNKLLNVPLCSQHFLLLGKRQSCNLCLTVGHYLIMIYPMGTMNVRKKCHGYRKTVKNFPLYFFISGNCSKVVHLCSRD